MHCSSLTRVPLLAAVAAIIAATGCSQPFSVDVVSSVRLPLGEALNCTGAADPERLVGTIPADGQPDAHGSVTYFQHTLSEDNKCALRARWLGPLIVMDQVRKDVDEQLRDLGLEPHEVDLYVRTIKPTVTVVGFGDGSVSRGVTYRANLGVPEAPKAIMLEAKDGSDFGNPEMIVTTHQRRVIRSANQSWREGEPMEGAGDVAVDIDLDEASDTALPAALLIDFEFGLHGDAGARMMIEQDDVDEVMPSDE